MAQLFPEITTVHSKWAFWYSNLEWGSICMNMVFVSVLGSKYQFSNFFLESMESDLSHTPQILQPEAINKTEIHPCASSPCKNNGKCHSENGQVKCKCPLPFFGSLCEDNGNPCQYSRCLNGGICAPKEDFTGYTCSCPKGFNGVLCEKESGKINTAESITNCTLCSV